MPKVAVIGLGRFGMELAEQLAASGVQVIAIDRSPQLVNEIKDSVAVAVRLDATDKHAIASQDIDKVDACVIAIGENFEAALLTTVLVKQIGAPRIICRAMTEFHAEIFHQLGVDEVIQPEVEAGAHLAKKLANPDLEDVVVLDDGYALIEMTAPDSLCNQSLKELQLRTKYHVNLVAIKRPVLEEENGETVEKGRIISVPHPDDTIQSGDVLVVIGTDEALAKLPRE